MCPDSKGALDAKDRIRHTTTIMTCEKCWGDAFQPDGGGTQIDRYYVLVELRIQNPCSPREQAGQFWDDEQQVDRRLIVAKESA